MALIEGGIIDGLLRVARKRSLNSESEAEVKSGSAERSDKSVRRREARFSDFEAIAALKERSGLSIDSRENWQRLWRQNPALGGAGANLPIGWVQEADDGQIVGYLGSIPLLYQFGEQTLLATATTSYAVDAAYRSRSLGLVGSFFRQKGCDLYLDTTATVAAGRIMLAFKAQQVPQKDYGTVLFWVLDAQAFLRAAMQKLQVGENLGSIGARIGSPILHGDIFFRRRRPRFGSTGFSCRDLRVEEIADDFQTLWLRKLQEKPRVLAWRTPEVLRWHFLIPHGKRTPHVLACYSGGRMEGYVIVVIGGDKNLGLRKAGVADLMAAGDNPEVIRELLAGAYEIAKKNGCDVLELLGFPEEVRRICLEGKPFSRNYPACPFFYKTDRSDLLQPLTREESWYACPFDGDATLSP
jgi:hypothetical protein